MGDLGKPIDEEPILERAADRIRQRNLESLANAQGPGGDPLAPNTKGYTRRKGHDRVGFLSGGMAAGLVSSKVDIWVGGNEARLEIDTTQGNADAWKMRIFLAGRPGEKRWQSAATPSGKRRAWQYEGDPVPPRDFVGIDERDLDATAEDAFDTIFKSWGFR